MMSGLPTHRFRKRFLLLMLLSLLPASAVLLVGSNAWRKEEVEASRESARVYVRLARLDLQQEINGVRDLLTALALSPPVQAGNREVCDGLVKRLAGDHEGLLNLGVIGLDGRAWCSALPRYEDVDLTDRDYFVAALRQGELVASRYFIGRITGKGGVAFARPVITDAGQVTGVAYASTHFYGLSEAAASLTLTPRDLLLVLDAGGTVVGRFPEDAEWRGRTVSAHPMVQQFQRMGSGEGDFVALDGRARYFVFDLIRVSGEPAFHIAVGIDEEQIAAQAWRIFHLGLLAALLVAASAMAILWFGAGRVVSRKLDAIVHAADRLASGDGGARLPESEPGRAEDEFDIIARAFNALAASLAQRESDWQAALAQVEAGSQRTESILDSLSARILVLDRAGRIVARNAAWGEGGHWPHAGADYRAMLRSDTALEPTAIQSMLNAIGGVLDAQARDVVPAVIEYALAAADGARWFEMRVTPLRGDTGGAVVAHEDISQRKALEIRLGELVAELERSNRELQDFAYVASHDLQEPLRKVTAFAGRIESLYAGQLDERGRDYLTRMTDAARRMQQLIEALLTMSRVSTRAQPMRRMSLDEIAAEVLADLEEGIAASGARVEVGPLPEVTADATQMRQLMQNLIGNAIKFHAPDVAPQVSMSGESAQPGWVAFSVCDRGIGFASGDAERIFAPFVRLHGRAEYEGSGLGLAVVKRIVERHRGRITASVREGGGACFRVELPEQPAI